MVDSNRSARTQTARAFSDAPRDWSSRDVTRRSQSKLRVEVLKAAIHWLNLENAIYKFDEAQSVIEIASYLLKEFPSASAILQKIRARASWFFFHFDSSRCFFYICSNLFDGSNFIFFFKESPNVSIFIKQGTFKSIRHSFYNCFNSITDRYIVILIERIL